MRGAVSCRFSYRWEKRTSAGYQALKWRPRPTTRGLRHAKACSILQAEIVPEGHNPMDVTGMKQGR